MASGTQNKHCLFWESGGTSCFNDDKVIGLRNLVTERDVIGQCDLIVERDADVRSRQKMHIRK